MSVKVFHRIFVCAACGRLIAGCSCPGAVVEEIHSCAFCASEKGRKS